MNCYNQPLPKDMTEILAYHYMNDITENDEVAINDDEHDGQFDEIFW